MLPNAIFRQVISDHVPRPLATAYGAIVVDTTGVEYILFQVDGEGCRGIGLEVEAERGGERMDRRVLGVAVDE